MSDDKRAEAMRKAIADSDAQKSSSSNPSKGSKFNLKDKVKIPGGSEGIKDSFAKLWGSKMGKIGIGVFAGVILLIIVVSIFSNISNKATSTPAEYEISNSIINVYENKDVPSGYSYDAYVEITNTGSSNIYVKDMSFKIVSADKNEHIMTDTNIKAFPAIIAPGEKGYIFNRFGTEVTGIWSADVPLALSPTFTVMRSDALPYEYPWEESSVKIEKTDHGQVMSMRVSNDTAQKASSMYVGVAVYNAKGYCIGISEKFLYDVEPHTIKNVQFDPLTIVRAWKNEDITNYMIFAY